MGDVEVTLTCTEGIACLEVCDNGPGLPEGFDCRYAAHTGLELITDLVRHDLRGESVYENRPTGGTCDRVTFSAPIELPVPLARS